jgi:hypothetical protein
VLEIKYTHKVVKDSEILFSGSADDCWRFIHDHANQSPPWAYTTYGGYRIVKA